MRLAVAPALLLLQLWLPFSTANTRTATRPSAGACGRAVTGAS